MSEQLKNLAIQKFLDFYKEDLDSEVIDEKNVVISFPVHFSGFHRVEVTVTQINDDQFVVSDGAKTLEELKNSGYELNSKLRKRLETISRIARIRVVNDFLVTESDGTNLGSTIQRFVEAAKTIGDAYLVQRLYSPRDTNLLDMVASFLSQQNVPFQTKRKIHGKVEDHDVDFYFPPNGVPGLALSIMGNPTRMAAEAWAFKSWDIKEQNERVKVGVVYDAEVAGERSTTAVATILKHSADMTVPSTEIQALKGELRSIGILKRE